MGSPRFGLAWLMALIAGLALDIAAIRAWLIHRTDGRVVFNTIDVLGAGGLPMANVLVVGIVALWLRRAWRPFLGGFVAAGALALALYAVLALSSTESLVMPYLHAVLRPVSEVMPRDWSVLRLATFYCITAAMLGSPQLALAIVGGALARRFVGVPGEPAGMVASP